MSVLNAGSTSFMKNKRAWQCIQMTSSSPSACRDTEQENSESSTEAFHVFLQCYLFQLILFTLALDATTFPSDTFGHHMS